MNPLPHPDGESRGDGPGFVSLSVSARRVLENQVRVLGGGSEWTLQGVPLGPGVGTGGLAAPTWAPFLLVPLVVLFSVRPPGTPGGRPAHAAPREPRLRGGVSGGKAR